MTDVGLCRECGREQKLTPKNGNTVRHKGHTGGGGLYDSPVCKGSGKLPVLVRPCICGTCMSQTLFRADGRMARHRNEDGAWCEMGEAAMEIKDQLGAVEASVNAAATQHSAQQAAMSRESDTAEIQPMLNPERPTESLEGESHRLSATGSGVPLPTKTSGNGTAPSTDSPPSSSAMFGDAGATVRAKPRKRQPLAPGAEEIAVAFKELFWSHDASRSRSMQVSVGPSEVGLECTRRLAYKLSNQPTVNYSKDGWAAWIGTQGHSGLEQIYREANGTTSRFLIEVQLEFGSAVVPKGTADLYDRKYGRLVDHKFPGKSSLAKMWLDGPSEQYKKQLQMYAYGLERAGESVQEVSLVGYPRESGNLDELYVYVAPYDRQVALDAISRAESVAGALSRGHKPWDAPKVSGFLCQWCPFYLKDAPNGEAGCRG